MPSPPTATTDPATDINGNAATLNATVNPNGSETTVYFEWWTDIPYENSTTPQSIGSGTGDVSVAAYITNLSTSTTYYYRAVATNTNGTSYGDDMSFTTTAGTYLSGGTISEDTTWTYAGSPYIVTGDISVWTSSEPKPTLTIEPGVVVKFNTGTGLRIGGTTYSSQQGILNAQGTANNPIIFTSNKPAAEKAPGDWDGIYFWNQAPTQSILDYVTVEYGGYGNWSLVKISRDSSPIIRNSTIRYSLNHGISVSDSASVTVMDSVISNNTKYGIYVSNDSAPSISGTSFISNGDYPLNISAGSTGNLGVGNTASGNGTDGIEMRGGTIQY